MRCVRINVLGSFSTIYQYVLLQNVKFRLCFSSCIQYFNENIFPLNMIDNESFNIMLTNDIISFEQLSPDYYSGALIRVRF